ncbi:MAG: hypothetical protein EA390_09740 [Balneolaceae bacterium]|nr:MAG: hypothetical protein EA390_09740 [Balneolaceae bacterium]
MIYLLTIWTVFTFSVQDTIPPAERDTIPPVPADTLQIPIPQFPDTLQMPIPQFPDTLPDPTAQDTIPELMPPDTTQIEQEPEEVALDTIQVWNYRFAESLKVAETDSTLRWVNMVNLFDRFYREKGAITYRLGTIGRMDAMDLHGYETRHFNLELEGLILNDPLTGAVNWNRLPIRKIHEFSEADYGPAYRAQTRLIDYYLTQPRTYLNYDEGKFDYRSLDFVFTQNIRQQTNIEFSFWDRRDGGGYNRSNVEGRQAAVMIYNQLNDRWMLKGTYLNNAMDRDEPFGYVVQNPLLFSFNRFVEQPNRPNARSNQTSSDIYFQTHYRPDKYADVRTEFGLHLQRSKWSLSYAADTLDTQFDKAELYARQHLSLGSAHLTATGRAFYLGEATGRNITESGWLGGRADLDFTQHITSWSQINAYAKMEVWDDSRTTTEFSGRLLISPGTRTEFSLFGGLLSAAPDIQAVYWQSQEFSGNSSLQNEETLTAGAKAQIGLGSLLSIGFRGDYRKTENAVFVNSENTFVNIDPYEQVSGTGWLSLDSRIFEGEVSATYKRYFSDSQNQVNRLLDTSGDRTWIKGHLYWKNYLFNRATFVTAGFSGVFSPNPFRTAEFLTPLNRWQHGTNLNRFQTAGAQNGTNDFINPSYHTLDFDLSARIRWFMLLLKWENILDRVNQLGYFETTGYPMPERRFIFGLRVLFTN